MAKHKINIHGSCRRSNIPYWQECLKRKGIEAYMPSGSMTATDDHIWFQSTSESFYSYFPLVTDINSDTIELLVKYKRDHLGSSGYTNAGPSFHLGELGENGKDVVKNSYRTTTASAGSNNYSIRKNNIELAGSSMSSSLAILGLYFFTRLRYDGTTISMKIWKETEVEPDDWMLTASDSEFKPNTIFFSYYNNRADVKIAEIAYAIDGDTASIDDIDMHDIAAGYAAGAKDGDTVLLCSAENNDIIHAQPLDNTGYWTMYISTDEEVYIRIEQENKTTLDLTYAKLGEGYLGGDLPDGALKDDGIPTSGEVRVLVRSGNGIINGALVDSVGANPSGEWRVDGLSSNIVYDVVARKEGRSDAMRSNVMAAEYQNRQLRLVGNIYNKNSYTTGVILAKGAVLPITASVTGVKPLGLTDSNLTVDGNSVSCYYPIRDYGDFSFNISIADSNNKSALKEVVFKDASRANFVNMVGSVALTDRGSGSQVLVINVPNSIEAGDIMVVSLMHRNNNATISDSAGEVWTLAGISGSTALAEQYTSVYYRTATEFDAGVLISVNSINSSRFIAYFSAYRGRFAPLQVISSYVSNERYDDTYKEVVSNLTPISHNSGFMVRTVSSVYPATGGYSFIIEGMASIGPLTGSLTRLQVGYLHLGKPDTFNSALYTGNALPQNKQPDVAIILDEIRS